MKQHVLFDFLITFFQIQLQVLYNVRVLELQNSLIDPFALVQI